MMQRWGEDAVRFMSDASEYGTYYKELSAVLLPYLPVHGHVCDAGCGLGYLAQELSSYCKEVTALDSSAAAVSAMLKRQLPQNLHVQHTDIFSFDAAFDAMIFCYFGRTDEILYLAKRLCKGNVLIVKRECAEHTFSLGEVKHRKHTVEHTLNTLRDLDVPYTNQQLTLEMGQPFRNLDDAVAFFRLYNKSELAVEEKIVKARLIQTGRSDFPLYLPSQRKMELIVFSAADIPIGEC